jgi:hypothetical protein
MSVRAWGRVLLPALAMWIVAIALASAGNALSAHLARTAALAHRIDLHSPPPPPGGVDAAAAVDGVELPCARTPVLFDAGMHFMPHLFDHYWLPDLLILALLLPAACAVLAQPTPTTTASTRRKEGMGRVAPNSVVTAAGTDIDIHLSASPRPLSSSTSSSARPSGCAVRLSLVLLQHAAILIVRYERKGLHGQRTVHA